MNILQHITIPEHVQELVINGLKKAHKEQNHDFEQQKKSIRKRIDKIDKTLKEVFESGMSKHSESLKKNIEKWELERRTLLLEDNELLKTTKTFFEQSNCLLEFCKDAGIKVLL